ncbi:MAG: Flp pilus assembly protein CpaB [Chloroflexi bacterium]|nr:Flp pilus assembly protein CpaB [Chloroflexota bacterium]MBV9600653.1 Flp pilus assembly protein CpaB [Chloroflexota bacterium]
MTLSPARALRRPRRADPRAIVGVFLTLGALAGSVAFWVSATDARPVVIAVHDLPAGATLAAGDLGIAYIRADDAVYQAALPSEMLQTLVGRQLGEPIHAEQVLARAQLSDEVGLAADQVAITIPAHPDTAVDGRLRPGDSVQVLVTVTDKDRNEAHARAVVDRAQVFEVGRDVSLASSAPSATDFTDAKVGSIASVTLAVTVDQAQQLAEARRTGDLDIVLLPPAGGGQE